MLLGHARGKVGDLVFSRTNGQQVVRARAAVVKNPQTEKQMIQRILLNTVAQAYSRFSAITDHSFEGIPQGQKSMSYFMSKNLDLLRLLIATELAAGGDFGNVYAFAPINSNEYAANGFLIAKGSLPEIPVDFVLSTKATADFGGATYGDIIQYLGLQRGDQLTFVTTQGLTGERTTFHYARVILDPTTADGQSASLDTPFIVDGAINLPSPRNEGEFNVLALSDGTIEFNFAGTPVSGAAIIVSRQKTDGTWLRSNATLAVNVAAIGGWQKSLQDCLDLFESGSIDTLSEQYLNNAGRGRLAASNGVGVPLYVAQVYQGENGITLKNPNSDDSLTDTINVVTTGSGELNGVPVIYAYDAAGNKYLMGGYSRYQRRYDKIVVAVTESQTTAFKALGSDEGEINVPVGTKVLVPENDIMSENYVTPAILAMPSIGLTVGMWVNP